MGWFKITRKQRLLLTIGISFCFFIGELAAGFWTSSLALIADAFHYLSDLIGIVVAYYAVWISERAEPAPQKYTFGWQRATLLGAFFNGVFLLALGVSIFVQAVERFTKIEKVSDPKIVLIVGGIGLFLNVVIVAFLHEHNHGAGHSHGHDHGDAHNHGHSEEHNDEHTYPDREHQNSTDTGISLTTVGADGTVESSLSSHHEHKHTDTVVTSPGRDLGMLGVLIHVIGDAINNIGVIVSAVIIWKCEGEARHYADPAVSVFIAVMILATALPLVKNSGAILLQIAPAGIDLDHVKHDIEMIPGIESVHELHIWRLDQRKSIASAHVVVDGRTVKSFTEKAKIIMECLHAYGIHSATLQPEVQGEVSIEAETTAVAVGSNGSISTRRRRGGNHCQLICGSLCDGMRCCAQVQMQ